MRKLKASDFNDNEPGVLDLLNSNKAEIIEESVFGLVEIFKFIIDKIAEAAKNGTRIKRIRSLEEQAKVQSNINIKLLEEVTQSKKKIEELEEKLNKLLKQ